MALRPDARRARPLLARGYGIRVGGPEHALWTYEAPRDLQQRAGTLVSRKFSGTLKVHRITLNNVRMEAALPFFTLLSLRRIFRPFFQLTHRKSPAEILLIIAWITR